MYVENEEKGKGWKRIIDQYQVTVNNIFNHKCILLFKEKGVLLFFIIYPLGSTYSCLAVWR